MYAGTYSNICKSRYEGMNIDKGRTAHRYIHDYKHMHIRIYSYANINIHLGMPTFIFHVL